MSYIDKIVSALTINYQQELEAIKTNEHTVSIILSYSEKKQRFTMNNPTFETKEQTYYFDFIIFRQYI